jgi:hypothetical protein
MNRLTGGKFTPEGSMILKEFVAKLYLPCIEELLASEEGI